MSQTEASAENREPDSKSERRGFFADTAGALYAAALGAASLADVAGAAGTMAAIVATDRIMRGQWAASELVNSQLLPNLTLGQPDVATDLKGNACRVQPGAGEVPTLMPGVDSGGCEYAPATPQYLQVAPSVAQVDVQQHGDGGRISTNGGTGVVAGRDAENGSCFVLTADHVVGDQPAAGRTDLSVVLPNGRTYPAQLRMSDSDRDVALLEANTGADTAAACRPAVFAQDSNYRGPGVIVGFPEDVRNRPYQSPATHEGIVESDAKDASIINSISHTSGGNSGGPVANDRGEVFGLVHAGPLEDDPRSIVETWSTPVNANDVKRWLAALRRSP